MGQKNELNRAPFEIDLSRSRAPRAFRGRQNLWKDELKRIYHLVERQYDAILEAETMSRTGRHSDELWSKLPHVSIAIFGPSGSGKSSLLQTLVQDVNSEGDGVLQGTLKSKVGVLPVLDPTTWRSTDQFLYAFLASALETERKLQIEEEHSPPQGLSSVQLAFQEVNEYLRVVDEPESSEEHDPLGLSLQKLERHTAGLRLNEAVGRFVQELAKKFHSKVVLMPVDDLDMAPEHLMDSLQTYQSFLRHPRLIPIFTFTDRMAEELIDVHFRNELKNGNYSPDPAGKRLTISTKMAVQTLARCFPVRNRIRLGPAPARVQRARFKTGIGHGGDDSRVSGKESQDVLELLTSASFVLFGHPDSEDAHQVKAVLRPSTLRLQMQVVDAMSDCRFQALRTPQFLAMAGPNNSENYRWELDKITGGIFGESPEENKREEECRAWLAKPKQRKARRINDFFALERCWGRSTRENGWEDSPGHRGFLRLAMKLRKLDIGATWATIFNGATWSLLNVHRDALQELGLYLEDLYSWTPKELRSVVLNNILVQDRATRRTVVDRWFNRSDIRRSQVLSLLAANTFRPWMIGEEPYGDDETPIRKQMTMDLDSEHQDIDGRWDSAKASSFKEATSAEGRQQVRYRLVILAPKGLLWFLNLTLGFYLPQIMARSWEDALSPDDAVRDLMDGNGWDLERAPVNAARIADAKREIFPFGMLFLDLEGYQGALQRPAQESNWEDHLFLRIWTCCGASRGRFWAVFSLWRGLGFIGSVLEKGIKFADALAPDPPVPGDLSDSEREGWAQLHQDQKTAHENELEAEICRLIYSHILNGLLSGPIISRHATDLSLGEAFNRWEPYTEETQKHVRLLAKRLVEWLRRNSGNVIYPMPAGNLWMGWKECFVRRIHGEAILGSLWPRLESGYIEDHSPDQAGQEGAAKGDQEGKSERAKPWMAATAAEVWSNYLLEYWRGCSPVLLLLLSCPIFPKSREHFEGLGTEDITILSDHAEEERLKRSESTNPDEEPQEAVELHSKLYWLSKLGLDKESWKQLKEYWTQPGGDIKANYLVNGCLEIRRTKPEDFAPPKESHHSVALGKTAVDVKGPYERNPQYRVRVRRPDRDGNE